MSSTAQDSSAELGEDPLHLGAGVTTSGSSMEATASTGKVEEKDGDESRLERGKEGRVKIDEGNPSQDSPAELSEDPLSLGDGASSMEVKERGGDENRLEGGRKERLTREGEGGGGRREEEDDGDVQMIDTEEEEMEWGETKASSVIPGSNDQDKSSSNQSGTIPGALLESAAVTACLSSEQETPICVSPFVEDSLQSAEDTEQHVDLLSLSQSEEECGMEHDDSVLGGAEGDREAEEEEEEEKPSKLLVRVL